MLDASADFIDFSLVQHVWKDYQSHFVAPNMFSLLCRSYVAFISQSMHT